LLIVAVAAAAAAAASVETKRFFSSVDVNTIIMMINKVVVVFCDARHRGFS
jgi:cobalamin biosynthesis protein CbiD